jgi:glutathione S-transferase
LKVCAIKGKSFSCTNWTSVTQVDISGLSHLLAYRARARPAVIAAIQAEGLT